MVSFHTGLLLAQLPWSRRVSLEQVGWMIFETSVRSYRLIVRHACNVSFSGFDHISWHGGHHALMVGVCGPIDGIIACIRLIVLSLIMQLAFRLNFNWWQPTTYDAELGYLTNELCIWLVQWLPVYVFKETYVIFSEADFSLYDSPAYRLFMLVFL